MTGVDQHLHRLHQFIEVEAGPADLAVLEVELIGVGKNNQNVSGMGAGGAEAQGNDFPLAAFLNAASRSGFSRQPNRARRNTSLIVKELIGTTA